MKTVLFTNFSNEDIEVFWDGVGRKYKAGESKYLPDYLAEHSARLLTNRELLRLGQERSMSPKKPEDFPEYMKLFNKAYTPDENEAPEAPKKNALDVEIEVANKNRENKPESVDPSPPVTNTNDKSAPEVVEKSPQIKTETTPVGSDEESFADKPVENQTN